MIGQIVSLAERLIRNSLRSKEISPKTKIMSDMSNISQPSAPPLSPPTSSRPFGSLEAFRLAVMSDLPAYIARKQEERSYKRALIPLEPKDCNAPIPLNALSRTADCFATEATFHGYNADTVRDYRWGCAWRAVQTCLSTYAQTHLRNHQRCLNFDALFHLFGPLENLQCIYRDKYPGEELLSSKPFAPYDIPSGWAEPFIGEMALHFFNIPSRLVVLNGTAEHPIPEHCYAPRSVFHHAPITFDIFRQQVEEHFKEKDAAPLMIDDGFCALNIIGVSSKGSETQWMADPHIQGGANPCASTETPVGLYTITLNEKGEQTDCSLRHEDSCQTPKMFSSTIYQGFHFATKRWMILFPGRPAS